MQIAVLGTGMVGRALSARFVDLGHRVLMGTRDVDDLMARTEPDMMGNVPFAQWHVDHQDVTPVPFADAVSGADLLVNAIVGTASLRVLQDLGAAALDGRVLMDTSNPLDFSRGFPPTLTVCNTDSLGEQIQRAHPALRVVKALNTLNAGVMIDPAALPGAHTTFVAGDDADAKSVVTDLLRSMGHADVMDLGDITASRGLEMWLALWVRIMGTLGTAQFNIHVVR